MKHFVPMIWCTSVLTIVCHHALQAEEATIPSKCTKEELMKNFPQEVVESVLLNAKIPQDQASAIAKDLSQKDRELEKMVEEKAAKLDQNPFKDLSQRDLAIKIYRETRYEMFAKVLKANGIKNDDQIQSLLEETNAARSKQFIDCIKKQTSNSSEKAD